MESYQPGFLMAPAHLHVDCEVVSGCVVPVFDGGAPLPAFRALPCAIAGATV